MIIKEAILKVASQKSAFQTADILAVLNRKYSRQAVVSHINELVKSKTLVKIGSTRGAKYALPKNIPLISRKVQVRFKNKSLEESQVFSKLAQKIQFFSGLKENVASILEYAFTEMFNNAIEHSSSKNIAVEFSVFNNECIQFIVKDFGIGVFRNIMHNRGLKVKSRLFKI